MFGDEASSAARAHALDQHPREAVGLVAGGEYLPFENVAPDPLEQFQLPTPALERIAQGGVQGVIHSHCAPRHGRFPSSLDMRSQIEINLPFGIVWTEGETATEPLWWGDFRLEEELVGRQFMPGIHDCYGLLRSYYWQERGVRLVDVPRDADFWYKGEDLLRQSAPSVGFRYIEAQAAVAGDLLFMSFDNRTSMPSHCAILLDRGLILHHLPRRLSRREPIGPWRGHITHWLRHEA